MYRVFSFLIVLLVFSYTTRAQITKHVLFLGNSYTYVNDLPIILSSLASNTGDNLIYQQNTPGGYSLQGHSTNATSLGLIQQGSWDYMVLQEQSQKPSWPISQVMSEVYPYAKTLCDTFYANNPCSKPLFFMTWGRKNGDSYNCPNWPPVCTYKGMDSLLNLRYRMLADSNKAYVSPVGAVWHFIRDNYSNIELYSSDESHPSLEGSYAAACTFYSLIFQKDPVGITDNYGIDSDVAQNIRLAAKLIAFDSLQKWNVGVYPIAQPVAQFQFQQLADTVYFTNLSTDAMSYLWSFDDGSTSTVENPAHYYPLVGNYNVILKVEKCEISDTSMKVVSVAHGVDGIDITEQINAKIYPNPVTDNLVLEFENIQLVENLTLYNVTGELLSKIESIRSDRIVMNLNRFENGAYFIRFNIKGKPYEYKVIKAKK
jgi:PKD repeat protein